MSIKILRFQSWNVTHAHAPPETRTKEGNGCSLFQRRYVVALLGFLCTMVMHSQRVNISFSLVAMVNATALENEQVRVNESMDCPAWSYNSTTLLSSRGEFSWTPELQGYILSAGYLGVCLTQIPGGTLTRMFTSKIILVSSLLVASVCNILSPVAASYSPYLLLGLALIRAMAQGMKPPALCVMMSNWFPRKERGFLSAFIICGYPAGAFLGTLVSGFLCDLEFLNGWPLPFYAFGLFGVMVALVFLFCLAERPEEDSRISDSELRYIEYHQEVDTSKTSHPTPWIAMLKSLSTYALVLGLFGQNWAGLHFISVHPIYLATILHIPVKQNGAISCGPQMSCAIVGWCTCYLSYWMSRHGKLEVATLRKICNSLSCIVCMFGLLGIYVSKCNIMWNEVCLYIANGSLGIAFAGSYIAAVDMSPTFSGPLMGFAGTVSNLAGFFVPVMVGHLTNNSQNMEQWGKVFLITTGIILACGLAFQFLGSAEVQKYDPRSIEHLEKEMKVNEAETHDSTPISSRL